MIQKTTSVLRPLLLATALALSALHAGAVAPAVKAPPVDTPTHVLFVGNSYFYYGDSLHNHVRRMVDAARPGFYDQAKFKSATIGGATLDLAGGRLGFDARSQPCDQPEADDECQQYKVEQQPGIHRGFANAFCVAARL